MKLTAKSVRELPAVDKPRTFFDSDLKGFGVRCTPPSKRSPNGTMSWCVEYRPGAGGRGVAKRRFTIASASVVDAGEARRQAKDILAGVQRGEDPAATRGEARAAGTIRDLVGSVTKPFDTTGYQAKGSPNWKDGSSELFASYWRLWMLPEIGSKKARDVTHADVLRLHAKIGEQHKVTANRCISLLRHFYGWAAKMDETPKGVNPARGVEMYNESGKERYLSSEELGSLSDAIVAAEAVGIPWVEPEGAVSQHRAKRPESRRSWISPSAAAAIRLLLLTGARLREILHLRWSEVDFHRGLLLLPDSKTGRKTIVLGAAALEIVEALRATTNGEFVIAGADPDKPRSDLNRPWALVCRAAGLKGVRLHDLRHTFASVGASSGLGLPMIGRLLGHADARTTARYAHLAHDASRRAADLIGGDIASAMRGGATPALEPAHG
jgi:integrase